MGGPCRFIFGGLVDPIDSGGQFGLGDSVDGSSQTSGASVREISMGGPRISSGSSNVGMDVCVVKGMGVVG